MCGIVGFTGSAQAAPILLDGLSKLEYRGYDSAGLAVQNAAGKIEVVKAKGRLRVLSEMTDEGKAVQGCCGIGHTRWATHGEPSVVNAHPHYSRDQKIAVVHNGIIENYQELKTRLINKGFTFASQTDTEVVAQLLDYYYTGVSAGDSLDAITRMMMHVRGSYALGILFADQPGVVYAVRKDSPLIVGKAENGSLIASDVPALLKYTRTVYYIDNLEIARLTPDSIEFFNIDKEPVEKEASTIEWDAEAAEKGGYEHFMMKEIHEQPTAVRDTLSPRIKDGRIDLSELGLDEEAIKNVRRIYIIGCGSAYHVGVAARYVFESLARLPVEVDVASEFRYRDPVLEPDSMAVIISQSGETADTLAALRECKERGVRTIGIVNVVGSSIAREADATLYTWAGPEIAVATTKAYSTQLAACYLLAVEFARVRGKIEEEKYAELVAELQILPDKIAVCGFSAGGHLALSGAVLDIPGETAQQRPNAVILGYPVITAGEFAHRGSFVRLAGSEDAAAQQVFTLEDKVTSDTPPVFVWHTMEDKTVPVENTLLLLAALRRAGVPCEAHLFEKGAHGTSISTAEVDAADPHRAHWVALCLEWLGETFGFKLS